MKAHADKTSNSTNRSVGAVRAKTEQNNQSVHAFEDNRKAAMTLQKFQNSTSNTPQSVQFRNFQDRVAKSSKSIIPGKNNQVVQGYFEGRDLNGTVPDDARVSENLSTVREGKQHLYTSSKNMEEANSKLEAESKIILTQGERKDYHIETKDDGDGMSTISLTDFYQAIPRYNPNIEKSDEDLPRTYSSESDDSTVQTKLKHIQYVLQLDTLKNDLQHFYSAIQQKGEKGLQSSDPMEWWSAVSGWLKQNPVRDDVLRLGLMEIVAEFSNRAGAGGDINEHRKIREEKVEKLLLAYYTFMNKEISSPDSIVLPTDCGAMVHYIVKFGKTRENDHIDDNPPVGSNYYTELPENKSGVGWNYHWAGVVLKDGPDNVTLESAGGTSLGSLGKTSWWFEMYGTKSADQSFKKQTHQTHINRNRDLVDGGNENTRAVSHQQLDQHQQTIDQWTNLDSDRD